MEIRGFMDISFTDWIVFKMLIKIYGPDKLISVLKEIIKAGGINEIKTISG